jgi:DNA integrity scanning protein DisA with diadenylate cyclase activity
VPSPAIADAALLVGFIPLFAMPLAIGVAILRYHLYDIDQIISRTIAWAVISGVLLGAFVVLVVALQAALTGFTGGETLAVAMSTLGACALFQPVRARVQRAVDRRFDRARYDSQRTAQAFAERLRDDVDLDALASELRQTAMSAIRPASAAVWLADRSPGRD